MKNFSIDKLQKGLYIGGKWLQGQSRASRDTINPATGGVICEVAEADKQDALAAIAIARSTFDNSFDYQQNHALRKNHIETLASAIVADKPVLAELESLDTGKPLSESLYDIDDVVDVLHYYANLAKKHTETIETNALNSNSQVVSEPIGVCAMICPWNYPLLQASWKIGPALAAGCTMVLKPSELTPLTSLRLAMLVDDAGLPPGIFNLILGTGQVAGATMSESPLVDLISFTGGLATGKRIMQAASTNVKKLALELGGKNPHIIFEDADLDQATEAILNGVFYHAGQVCSAGSRLLLHKDIHDNMVDRVHERIKRIQLGGPFDKGSQMGPVISAAHRKKIESYFEIAREEKATIKYGGSRPAQPPHPGGYFIQPTLITDCSASMRIVQEEVFGPVITVEKFSDEAEAIKLANDTVYGLSAGFFTKDKERAKRVSAALRFGTVWINDFNIYFASAPWGGYKQSGIGRELGRAGLDEYFELKHIYTNEGAPIESIFGA